MSLKAIASLLLEMGDVRVLFALHRAAVSGPVLSKKLIAVLTRGTARDGCYSFLTNPAKTNATKTKANCRVFSYGTLDFGPLEQQLALLQKYGCKEVDQKTDFATCPGLGAQRLAS